MDFTELLREFLEKAELSHEDFAELVGVSGPFVSRVVTGRDKFPLDRITSWADALRLKAEDRVRFTEAAHLSRATDEVRALVRRLRTELEDTRENQRRIVAHLRGLGHKLPKGVDDV